jgi:hypothetical protein
VQVQLDPALGLEPDMILDIAGRQYRVGKVDNDIVSIEPPLEADAALPTTVSKVTTFVPYGGARNRQTHALYLGHSELLDLPSGGTVEVFGAQGLVSPDYAWEYWGKKNGDTIAWQEFDSAHASADAAVLLKPKGSVEERSLDGASSRWIRARWKNAATAPPLMQAEQLALRINFNSKPVDCQAPDTAQRAQPEVEAMANTTPLTLTSAFYPLGRQPKQFDAFYVGCTEAFSKSDAEIDLCLDLADPTSAAFTAVRAGSFAGSVVAAVGKDRSLQLYAYTAGALTKFRERGPLQPPRPGFDNNASTDPTAPLDSQPLWRLPVWNSGNDFLVATSAGAAVWVWREHATNPTRGGWISFGNVPNTAPTGANPIAALVYLVNPFPPASRLVALLANGTLAIRSATIASPWIVRTPEISPGIKVELKAIVPVLDETTGLASSTVEGLVGIGTEPAAATPTDKLYSVTIDGRCTELSPTTISSKVWPVAVKRAATAAVSAGKLVVIAVKPGLDELLAVDSNGVEIVELLKADVLGTSVNAEVVGASLEPALAGSHLHVLASIRANDRYGLASWAPFETGVPGEAYISLAPSGTGAIGGAPTRLGTAVLVPGTRGDVFFTSFRLANRIALQADVHAGLRVPASAPVLMPTDYVAVLDDSVTYQVRTITGPGLTREGETFYPVDSPFGLATSGEVPVAYHRASSFSGNATTVGKLTLQADEFGAIENTKLLVQMGTILDAFEIDDLDKGANPWVATLSPDLPTTGPATYWLPIPTGGRVVPFMQLNPAASGNWDPALVEQATFRFTGTQPAAQRAKIFSAPGATPLVVVLERDWTQTPPGTNTSFVMDAAMGEWARRLGDSSSNPELSWEYWNGTGWSKLDSVRDETLNLKTSGDVKFTVPRDLESGDWAGKTNFWIRARLIGGDYGQEQVTVTTTTLSDGSTQQTVHRSSEGITPPSIVGLRIFYSIAAETPPTYVRAEDSGSLRDQSDANRTQGALVEAFVPLATLIGRLAAGGLPASSTAGEANAQGCDCVDSSSSGDAAPQAAVAVTPASGRALYLGFDAKVAGEQINVLMLVDRENPYDAYAPLHVDALIAGRFERIVASDATRALGESGLVTMNFTVPPTTSELFGKELKWVRVSPSGDSTSWGPSLRGAYLNAVWARAAETMTRELVGSSTGEPNLTLQLARPPLVEGSLELRVREPLTDEEIALLNADDPKRALTAVEDLPGVWVRWKRTIDPADCGPRERVYALDEATGVIRFGDSVHGAIPPVGRDAIVAFSYRRTEPAPDASDSVPANQVTARTALSLVTPVESVEAAVAADDAAGGAPAEAPPRVIRFGSARLRHRGRAVSARDFEDIALESSPDIAQVRCLVPRAGGASRVRVIVVMRGADPMPSRAVKRELRRVLLEASPVTLASPRQLRIEGPALRRLHIDLRLRVDALETSGALADYAKREIRRFLDPATGGPDGTGWPLGTAVIEDDIAYRLLDAPDLESIERIALIEIDDAGTVVPPSPYRPHDLAWLPEDAIRIEFAIPESVE